MRCFDQSPRRGKRGFLPVEPSTLQLPERDVDLAYLAGIMDGEGTIRYEPQRSARRSHGRWIVAVVNTDLSLLHWLEEIGGKTYPVGGTHKPCFRWVVTRRSDVYALLMAIRPYMRIKAQQADKALEFLEQARAIFSPR